MSDDKARGPRPLTTESGAPVADNQHSQTAGVGGPMLLQDQHLLEKLAHFRKADPEYGARLDQAVEAHKAQP